MVRANGNPCFLPRNQLAILCPACRRGEIVDSRIAADALAASPTTCVEIHLASVSRKHSPWMQCRKPSLLRRLAKLPDVRRQLVQPSRRAKIRIVEVRSESGSES